MSPHALTISEHAFHAFGVQGFEGYLSSKDTLRKRARAYRPEDKIFSLSSKSSPAVRLILRCACAHNLTHKHQRSCWLASTGRGSRKAGQAHTLSTQRHAWASSQCWPTGVAAALRREIRVGKLRTGLHVRALRSSLNGEAGDNARV